MRRAIIAAGISIAAFLSPASVGAQDLPGYRAPFADTLQTRIFPLFAMIRRSPDWTRALRGDDVLGRLVAERAKRVPAAGCRPSPQCVADAWTWTDADIAVVEARLRAMARDATLSRALIAEQVRASGRFGRHSTLSDTDLLAASWRDAAAALNRVLAVYAKGEKPRYPDIDATIFDVAKPEFAALLEVHGVATAAMGADDDLFFDPSLRYAIGLLHLNERTNAGSHRPLLEGDNAAAASLVPGIDWQKTPYSALLVFGHGAQDAQSRTGPLTHIRLRIAADRFARGAAPFVIVSGGNVHPDRTPFNEATEMKRLLVTHHGVPADRIFIEPHARHTTTNMRNAARLMLSAGFPAGREALIVSDHRTIGYITGTQLAQRNLDEMGVQPGRVTPGPDRFTARFTPSPLAFHVEAMDPLDP